MLQERWLATVGLCLVVAVVIGVVLGFAAGAERTATVADRYTAARGGAFDGVIYQNGGRPRTAEVAALPGAASADSITFIFGAIYASGTTEPLNAVSFSGTYIPIGSRLISGRDVNPAVNNEFIATRRFVDAYHAAIGDKFDLVTLTQEQADASGFDTPDPAGPTVEGVLVGIVDGPSDLDDPTPGVVFSPALLDDPQIGVAVSIMSVRFDPGVDLATFRTQLDTLPQSDTLSLDQGVLVSAAVRKAVDAQALGLWVLAAVAAVAAVAVVGQLITRNVRLSDADRDRLSAIGYVDAQIMSESLGRAAVPIVSGAVLGIAIATAMSGVFPTGLAHRIEPDPGVRFEATVLLAGAATFIGVLMVWMFMALLLTRLTSRRAERPSAAVEAIATRTGSATAATGLRFAFTRRARDGGSIRAVVIGLSLTIAGLVGAITFATSLDRLVTEPARYGANYDVMIGSGAESISDEVRSGLDNNSEVAALMLYADGQARFGPTTLRLVGMEPVRGDIAPKVLAGRLPVSDDEIALGRLAARALNAKIGDEVPLDGGGVIQRFRVTGIAVVPSIGVNEGIGQDGVVTLDGLARLDPSVVPSMAVVKFRSTSSMTERLALLKGVVNTDLVGDVSAEEARPAAIVNVARVRSIPFVLAAVLAALAVLTVAHVMVTSVQKRRRDVAILRSIGADRRWVSRAMYWQTTTFVLLPIAIGVPVGLIIGSTLFRSFADSIGTLNDASIPVLLVAMVVAGLLILANAVAALPARLADRVAPALILQSE